MSKPLHVFVIAGEHSGDQLGFKLMQALRAQTGGAVVFSGVGGPAMEGQGLQSLFPLSDIAVMGFSAVIPRLPTLIARVRATVRAAIDAKPDILIIIDSPDFTHAVAKRVRKKLPTLPVVDYVSPSVWAWRPGRARKMRAYIDHVLALLPFEPAAHLRLNGPPCTYVGHPLIERLDELRPDAQEAARRSAQPPLVLVLPGSRGVEIQRLMPDFGAALALITASIGPVDFVLPAVSYLREKIEAQIALWPVKPRIVAGEAEKYAAFRQARAALAASGTVTLELALAGVPMVVAYKVSKLEEQLKYVISVTSIVLPNLILENRAIPELLQQDCTPDTLSAAMIPLIAGGAARDAQLAELARLDRLMVLPGQETPSGRAAALVLEVTRTKGRKANSG